MSRVRVDSRYHDATHHGAGTVSCDPCGKEWCAACMREAPAGGFGVHTCVMVEAEGKEREPDA